MGLISTILLFDNIKISKFLNFASEDSLIVSISFGDKSNTFKSSVGILLILSKDLITFSFNSKIINDLKLLLYLKNFYFYIKYILLIEYIIN